MGGPNVVVFRVESLPARVQSFSRLQTGARRQTSLKYAAGDVRGVFTRLLKSRYSFFFFLSPVSDRLSSCAAARLVYYRRSHCLWEVSDRCPGRFERGHREATLNLNL